MLRTTNRRRYRWTALTVGALTATAIFASANSQAATPSPKPSAIPTLDPNNPTKVKIADSGTANLLAIAKGEGFFKKYGLDPELSSIAGGVAIIAALQGGSIDFGYADFFAGINAIKNGFDLSLVEPNNYNPTNYYVMVKSGGNIKTVADLAGKNFAVTAVPQIRVNLRGFLKANGVNPDSARTTILGDPTGGPAALERGSVDALPGVLYLSLAQNDGKNGYNFRSIGNPSSKSWSNPKASTAAFWATGNTTRNNPAAAYAVNWALHDFHKWWLEQTTDKKVALIKQYTGTDYNALVNGNRERLEQLVASSSEWWQVDPIDLAATQSWYQDGLDAAPDLIGSGVDWQSHVFASAKTPLPSAIPVTSSTPKPTTKATPKPTIKPIAKATPKPTATKK